MADQQGTATAAPAGNSGGASAPAAAPASGAQASQQSSGNQSDGGEAAPRNPVAAAIAAKASAQGAGQAAEPAQTKPDAQAAGGQPVQTGPDGGQAADGAGQLEGDDGEVEKWLESKGVKLGDVRKNPEVQKLLDMHRNLEGTYTKDRQALRELQDKEKTWLAQQQVQPVDDKSPVEQLDEMYASAITTQCQLHGCANEAQLAEQYPNLYAQLKAAYDSQWRKALREETRWEQERGKREAAKAEREAKLAEDLRRAQAAMRQNVLEAKEKDPSIETNLTLSGAHQFINEFAKMTKIPNSMILAHKPFFQFFAEAAHSIMAQRNIDKTKEAWRQEYEDGVAKAAKASGVSPIDPTPPDNKAVLAKQLQRRSSANEF